MPSMQTWQVYQQVQQQQQGCKQVFEGIKPMYRVGSTRRLHMQSHTLMRWMGGSAQCLLHAGAVTLSHTLAAALNCASGNAQQDPHLP
jgi:hypothetical protein